jgi:MoaA/NifB/PqqE/SkfB family radical SAM enzyme
MKNAIKLPKTATIAITQKCNSKCTFCKIWECKNPIDLDENLIDRLPVSLKEVNITGGEPFLHAKIETIVEKLSSSYRKVIINTNGLVKIKSSSRILEFKNVGIRFSLDGIGEAHDGLRGVPGNFQTVMKQINNLRTWNFKDLGIFSTFSDSNWHELVPLYELSRSLGIGFSCAVAANSETFYKTSANGFKNAKPFIGEIQKIIMRELRSLRLKNMGKALFLRELARFAAGEIKVLSCLAGSSFFFMASSGDISACNMRDLPMGNLADSAFEDLWFSSISQNIRSITARCDKPCWTMCNAKQILKDNLPKHCFKFLQPMETPYEQSELVRNRNRPDFFT